MRTTRLARRASMNVPRAAHAHARGIARFQRRPLPASPASSVARFQRRPPPASPASGVARLRRRPPPASPASTGSIRI
ncbi:hypothetical protein C6T66_24945 [Burkholderia multivorans]|nr:hypothetical protein C6T66_24945 [Burkholderia multivorans]